MTITKQTFINDNLHLDVKEASNFMGSSEKSVRNMIRKSIRNAETKKESVYKALTAGFKLNRIHKITGIKMTTIKRYAREYKKSVA